MFTAMSVPLSSLWALCYHLWNILLSFYSLWYTLWFPPRFSLGPTNYLQRGCITSRRLDIFLLPFCYWFLVTFPVWHPFSLLCGSLFHSLGCGPSGFRGLGATASPLLSFLASVWHTAGREQGTPHLLHARRPTPPSWRGFTYTHSGTWR